MPHLEKDKKSPDIDCDRGKEVEKSKMGANQKSKNVTNHDQQKVAVILKSVKIEEICILDL